MATEANLSTSSPEIHAAPPSDIPLPTWHVDPVTAILYDFHTMEPLRFVEYDHKQLMLPLRRDILHRAIVYEGNMTRQGTASTKWRDDVHGSGRKVRPQKGSGRARLGDKKSPMLKGGGVAFGPHPRDFSTQLPKKIYDLAWRTALSYRFRRGQLIVVNDNISLPRDATPLLLREMFEANGWGRGNGRSLLITDVKKARLTWAVNEIAEHARVLDRADVDVKDLLETGRLIVEKKALDNILAERSGDLFKQPARAL